MTRMQQNRGCVREIRDAQRELYPRAGRILPRRPRLEGLPPQAGGILTEEDSLAHEGRVLNA